MAPNTQRHLFISAAWFNFLAGLPFIVAMGTVAELMGLQINPTAAMFIQITAAMIVVFGVAHDRATRKGNQGNVVSAGYRPFHAPEQ